MKGSLKNMNDNKKTPRTYRFNKDTIMKLNLLRDKELQMQKEGLGVAKEMTEIVEAAIDLYYTTYLDQDAGDDYMRRITSVVENTLYQYFNQYDLIFTKLLQTAFFNKEAELTILKLLNSIKFIERPRTDEELQHFISGKESIYESYILEKIKSNNDGDE